MAKEKRQSLYTRLAENTTDLVSEMDLVGTINYIFPSYLKILGNTLETLVEQNAFEIAPQLTVPKPFLQKRKPV